MAFALICSSSHPVMHAFNAISDVLSTATLEINWNVQKATKQQRQFSL